METKRYRARSDRPRLRFCGAPLLGAFGALCVAVVAVLLVQPPSWAQTNVVEPAIGIIRVPDVDLAATDLLVGEVLDITNAENWGGPQGVYLVAATGRKGQAIAAYSGIYVPTASEVIGVVTMTTPSGTAGRTHMVVTYASPTLVAATAAP